MERLGVVLVMVAVVVPQVEHLYQVRPDDVITLAPGYKGDQTIRDATELVSVVPAWLQADHDGLMAKVLRRPERDEIAVPAFELETPTGDSLALDDFAGRPFPCRSCCFIG